MADIYYLIDSESNKIYYTNEELDNYTLLGYYGLDENRPSNNKEVVISLYNDKFEFPSICPRLFCGCTNTTFDTTKWDTSNAKNIAGLFKNCKNLETIDLNGKDFNKVTGPSDDYSSRSCLIELFYGCTSLQYLDLSKSTFNSITNSNFDTSSMFYRCTSLKWVDISCFPKYLSSNGNFKPPMAESMFNSCYSLENIYVKPGTNWTSMNYGVGMFAGDSKLPNYVSNYTSNLRAYIGGVGYFTSVNDRPVQYSVYLKDSDSWNQIEESYLKESDSWKHIDVYAL